MSYMKIIVENLPKTTPTEIVNSHINTYHKKGKDIKTQIRNDRIELYYIEEMN